MTIPNISPHCNYTHYNWASSVNTEIDDVNKGQVKLYF